MRRSLPERLQDTALVEGHFVLKSGNHGLEKFEFDRVSERRRLFRKTCRAMGELIAENFMDCEVVLTVGNGANCMAWPVAGHASKYLGRRVRPLTSAKYDGRFLTADKIFITGRRLVIVDDALTRGTSAEELAQSLEGFKPATIDLAVVANRSVEGLTELPNPLDPDQPIRVASLMHLALGDYPPELCPLKPERLQRCDLPASQS